MYNKKIFVVLIIFTIVLMVNLPISLAVPENETVENTTSNSANENTNKENSVVTTRNETQSNVQNPEVVPTENENKEKEATSNDKKNTNPEPTKSTKASTETKKSKNANLGNLGFTPTDFKGFKPWVTSYNAEVKNDVEQITVYATVANDSKKASITSGVGVHKLNEGDNSINVVVTAEDGTTKTYTINVKRAKADEGTVATTNTVNEESTVSNKISDLKSLQVAGYVLTPKFSPDVYEYKLNVNQDVSNLDVKAEGTNNNIKVEIVGNTDLQDGENTISILVHNEEKNTHQTYQIIVNKAQLNAENTSTTLNDALKKANLIRTVLIGIVAIFIIAVIVFIVKNKLIKYDDEDDEDEEDEEDDEYEEDDEDYDYDDNETFDLSNEEELFRRVNKEEFMAKAKDYDNEELDYKADIINTEEDDETGDDYFSTARKKGKHF